MTEGSNYKPQTSRLKSGHKDKIDSTVKYESTA